MQHQASGCARSNLAVNLRKLGDFKEAYESDAANVREGEETLDE